ncbi:MAG TPA: M1 family metallopeptidase [Saprospiraceae bacterium]|nr:M1 family metallopeptidase [Saprospiraceae bacterium]
MRLLLVALAVFPFSLPAQKTYFQQEVNYTITATLDDRQHSLNAEISMVYTNHSPDELPEIWMHCWPNAYASRRSAFARQKADQQDGKFYFAPDSSMGGLSRLDFKVDGQQIKWSFDPKNPDIARLQLPRPLAPGGSITISTPFVLDIPASFSRLGHVGQSYQMTQWFPKPAVYDTRGWHPIPYLDQGEFYSEFGAFDVTITLPANYVVGATGVLQNPEEWAFLAQKETETRAKLMKTDLSEKKPRFRTQSFPPSSANTKTLHYKAEKVHDFAWFADKRFNVMRDTARLASGRTVDCWAMFTDEDFRTWQKGAFYVRRAVEFYSECVGEYPWPHATAVHSALSAGGGMEYPMITVIGNAGSPRDLDDVITHEVGHNWFYGILASNEREHPWMDEGINTYYETRYTQKYYNSSMGDGMLPKKLYDPKQYGPLLYTGYLVMARHHDDTPPDTRSDRFTPAAYGLMVYMKTALCMGWLEKSVGTATFDQAMQAYYREWQFRHPYPEDFQQSMTAAGVDVGWFMQTMTTGRHTDYALDKVEKVAGGYRLTVRNKGRLNAPFPVTALRKGQVAGTQWYPAPASAKETVVFAAEDVDEFVIDRDFSTLDVRHQNNSRRSRVQVDAARLFEHPNKRTLGILPWLGWNNYDKTMIGLLLYNPPFPGQKIQYYLAPGLGIGSKKPAGLADIRLNLYPGGAFPRLTVGISAKSCQMDYHWGTQTYDRYYRIAPQVRGELRSGSTSFRHWLNLRTIFTGREVDKFDVEGNLLGRTFNRNTIYELRYEAARKRLPNPWTLSVALEFQDKDNNLYERGRSYLRNTLSYRQQFYYTEKRKITARFFAGVFWYNTDGGTSRVTPERLTLLPQGFNDYRFDQLFLGRTDPEGIFARQVSQTDGGFKNAFGSAYPYLGFSQDFAASLNLRADLPFRLPLGLPLKPYFDLGYFKSAEIAGQKPDFEDQLLWSGGLMLSFFGGGFEVYFPLVNAGVLQDQYDQAGGKYGSRITWSIRLRNLTPNDIADHLLH